MQMSYGSSLATSTQQATLTTFGTPSIYKVVVSPRWRRVTAKPSIESGMWETACWDFLNHQSASINTWHDYQAPNQDGVSCSYVVISSWELQSIKLDVASSWLHSWHPKASQIGSVLCPIPHPCCTWTARSKPDRRVASTWTTWMHLLHHRCPATNAVCLVPSGIFIA